MKKGQALVEFIIILPIFLFIILGVIDMGRIFYTKIILEEQISDVIKMYEAGNSEDKIKKELNLDKDIVLEKENDKDYINYVISKNIEIITPGLNLIFDNPYKLVVTRSIYNNV